MLRRYLEIFATEQESVMIESGCFLRVMVVFKQLSKNCCSMCFIVALVMKVFYGRENILDHRCFIVQNSVPLYEFGWLIPLPGLLHIEMNACKAFYELTWEVVLKDFCTKLGYNTPKALDYENDVGITIKVGKFSKYCI